MTKKLRRKIDTALKAKIVLEAMREQATMAELAVLRHAPSLHPELDSLTFGQIEPVLIDKATLVFEADHGGSC